jgi:large subunit ribosomal protein L13
MQKTYYPKPEDIERKWVLVDANDQNLGRLATRIAEVLIGKHKAIFTPGVDVGDFVVIVNAERVRVTGNKLEDKIYYRHTGYPGGLKETKLKDMLVRNPEKVLRSAVWGMVPHNKLGRAMMKKLKIYAGPDHPHDAQQPEPLDM